MRSFLSISMYKKREYARHEEKMHFRYTGLSIQLTKVNENRNQRLATVGLLTKHTEENRTFETKAKPCV